VIASYQVPERLTQSCFARRDDDLIQGGERMRFAMTTPLRSDFDAFGLRVLARNSKDAGQARRLLALAMIYEGGTRTEAAKTGCPELETVCNTRQCREEPVELATWHGIAPAVTSLI